MLDLLYKCYYDFKDETALEIIQKKKALIVQIPGLLETAPKKELFLIHKLSELVVKIYDSCSPILGLNLK
jgi:hypothetical protein